MSYINAGPITFIPNDVLDSPNGAVTNADFDVLDAEFELQFDTTYQSFYCYIGTVAGPDVAILRIQHDGTNFLFTMTAKDDYVDTAHFSNIAGAKALNTYGTVRITHDINNLYSVYLDAVLIDSATIATIDMGDGVFHFGYFGSGTVTVQNIDVVGVVVGNSDPVLDTPNSDIVIDTNSTTPINFGSNFSDADVGDTLSFSINPDISLLTGWTWDSVNGIATPDGSQEAATAVTYTITADDGGGGTLPSDVVDITVTAVVVPSFTIDSISDATPDAGNSTTITLSNETGTVTASCSAGALTGTYTSGQFVLNVPEPGLFGDLTLNYETAITVTLSDGTNTDTVSIQIQVPAGELFAAITSISVNGVYGNDVGLEIGDFGHFKNIVGDIFIDPATGEYTVNPNSNSSFDYSLYDTSTGDWSDDYETVNYVAPINSAATGQPVITGNAIQGQTLTANQGTIADANTVGALSYQWLRNDIAISGATASNYLLVPADVGTVIKVQASFTDGSGFVEGPLVSAGTNAVSAPIPVTTAAPYTICTVKGAANETIDGYPQKYFESPTDPNTWAYGFENDYTINATDIVLATNTSQDMRVGVIKIPFDAVYVADKTRFSITVELTGDTSGAQLQTAFSHFRDKSSLRISKNFNGSQTCTLEFDTIALSAIMLRAQHSGNGNDADSFGRTSRKYNVNLMGNFQLPIFINFANGDSSQSVVSVTASAVVGAAQFNVGDGFFRGKNSASDVPFNENDFFNQPLTSNKIARSYESCHDRGNFSGTHISTTAGSDIITVGDSSRVRVGDYAAIGYTFTGVPASYLLWAGDANYQVSTYQNTLTKDNLGLQTFVTEIISATQVRINRNALATYNPTVSDPTRVYTLITMPAPTASMFIGHNTDSYQPSPFTGRSKADYTATPYQGRINVFDVDLNDPLRTWNYNYVVIPNGYLFPIPDNQATQGGFDESWEFGSFEMHTPVAYSINRIRNTDSNAQFKLPGGRYAVEVYLQVDPDINGEVTTSRLCAADLLGESIPMLAWDDSIAGSGASKATRAFGGNFSGGMVTAADAAKITANCYTGLLPADVDADMLYAKTAIQHKIAITLSACQHMSPNYLLNNTGSPVDFYGHRSYIIQSPIVSGGTGYALEDVVYLAGESVTPTMLTVTAVSGTGAILATFVTHCGQYIGNPASATHATTTSGSGTGAIFDTTATIVEHDINQNMMNGVYPCVSVDNAAPANYNGSAPLGSTFTIDPNFNLDVEFRRLILDDIDNTGGVSIRASYHWYALLSAMQTYGAVSVDTAYNANHLCQLDNTMTSLEEQQFNGDTGSFTFPNMIVTSRLLTFVENTTPFDYTKEPTIEVIGGDGSVVQGGTYVDQGVYAYDEIEYDISDSVVLSGLDVNTLGVDTVNFDFTNLNGLTAITQTRSVTVTTAFTSTLGVTLEDVTISSSGIIGSLTISNMSVTLEGVTLESIGTGILESSKWDISFSMSFNDPDINLILELQ